MKAIGIALFGALTLAAACTATMVMGAQSARRKGRTERPVPSDAVIILGAYTDGYKPSSPLKSRLRAGLHLYRQGYASYFIVSGGQGSDEIISEARSMRRFLVLNGIAPGTIFMERHSADTWENLLNSRAVMERHNFRTAIVVTSDYHLPRALAVARELNMQVTGYPAFSRQSEFKYAMREVVARVKYTLTGRATMRGKGI